MGLTGRIPMPACDTVTSTAYKRRNSDKPVLENTSSVVNLVATTESCETLSSQDVLRNGNDSMPRTKCDSFRGFIYTLLCSFFITLSSVIVKKMTYISPGELSMVRNIGVFFGNLPIAIYSGENLLGPKTHRLLLLVRSFLGATALYVNLIAYRLLPLAEAAVIMSTLPVVVIVMARIFLKEPCGVVQTIALFITSAGVLLSIRLPELIAKKNFAFTSDDIAGIASAASCVLLLSVTFVSIRKMKEVHFSVVMIYLGLIGAIENAGLTSVLSQFSWPRCGMDRVWVLMVGIFGFVGNSSLTLAIQSEAVGIVSVLKASLDIVSAMMMQLVFFGEPPDKYNIYGAVLVFISVTVIGIRKWLLEKPEDSLARKRLWIFLF